MTTTTYVTKNSLTDRADTSAVGEQLSMLGDNAMRYSVVIVLLWIGAMKFTAYEAAAIEGLIASSPLTSWLYNILSLQGVSDVIGTIEIVAALAIALGSYGRMLALAGALGAVATFSITLSFLFSAPGWESSLGGYPALSVVPGQFLIKDIVLLAASISLLGRAICRFK